MTHVHADHLNSKLEAIVAKIAARIAAATMAGLYPKEQHKVRVHRVDVKQTRTRKGWQWSWHAVARNGRKMGWSGEFLTRKAACIAELTAVVNPLLRGIPVFEYGRDGKSRTQLWPNITAVSRPPKRAIACRTTPS